jgi:hypothetical protein
VALDGARAELELAGDGPVRPPFGDERQHLALALGEGVEQGASAPADEGRDHLRVERRAAVGDAFDRVDELRDVAHAVLEQVADARRVVAYELEHVGRLEVLGEDEHRDSRVVTSDLRGRHKPVVGVAGRHPDVDDRDVGQRGLHLLHEVVGVVRAPDDLVAGLAQQRGDPLAQQRVVVGDDHAQAGSRPRRRDVCGCNVGRGHGSIRGEPRTGHRCA